MEVNALPRELLVPATLVEEDVDDERVVAVVDPTANVVDDVVVDEPALDDVVGLDDPVVVTTTVVVTCVGPGRACAAVAAGDVDTVPY